MADLREEMRYLRMVVLAAVVFAAAAHAGGQSPSLAEKAQHAKELMAAGRPAEAVPIYRELIKSLPGNPGLILNLGLALDLSGQKREAIKEYEAVLKIDANSFPAELLMGSAYLDLSEPARALAPLKRAALLQPANSQAQAALGEAQLDLSHFADAAHTFRRLSGVDQANPKVWYGLGSSYEGMAQESFDRLAEIASGSGYWFDLVAESRLETKQTSSAYFFYRQALAKMPSLRGCHAAIAEIYRQTGHEDWAAAEQAKEAQLPPLNCAVEKLECVYRAGDFPSVVADGSNTPEACYWRTRACNRLALDAYSRLGQLPASVESYELRARINSKRRQFAEAAKELQEALKLAPGDSALQRELAIALYRSGSLQEAQSLFQNLLQRDRESATLNYFLGDTLLNSQKPQEALGYLQKAVEHDTHFLPAQKSLGVAYLQLGQADKAIPYLRAALPIDEDGTLHYQLGRAYQAHGDRELASEMFKQYQEAQQKNQEENQTVEKQVNITPP